LKFELTPQATTLILEHEIGGSEEYYNQFLAHPTVPPEASGVTIAIGVDLGYTSMNEFRAMFNKVIPDRDFNRLSQVLGYRGINARNILPHVKDITIPWKKALQVFMDFTVGEEWDRTLETFPGVDELVRDAQGVMVSLVFNRGTSLVGSRRTEMLAIKGLIPHKAYLKIADQILLMKRLWRDGNADGLLRRRNDEAKLMACCAESEEYDAWLEDKKEHGGFA